jgi:hypothetical protein
MADERGTEAMALDKAHYVLDNFRFFGYIGDGRHCVCKNFTRP